MTSWRKALGFASALLLAACQTASGPPVGSVSKLEAGGFTASEFSAFNRNLEPDDIVTTALYQCSGSRCGGFSLVAFGRIAATSDFWPEMDRLAALPPARRNRETLSIFRSAGLKGLRIVALSFFTPAGGGKGVQLAASGRIDRDALNIIGTFVLQGGEGRGVLSISSDRSVATRYGGRGMLE